MAEVSIFFGNSMPNKRKWNDYKSALALILSIHQKIY